MPVDSFLSWEALGFSPQTEVTLIIQDCYTRNVMGCYALNADTYRMITGSGEVHILEDGKGIPFRYNGAGIRCTGFSVNTSKTAILMEAEFPVDDEQESDFGKIPVDKSVILGEVFDVIQERKMHPPEKSYVAKKLSEGIDRILKKIGEEAGEVIIAAKNADPEEIGWEMADLIFHMWLVLGFYDLTPNIIYDKLIDRRK